MNRWVILQIVYVGLFLNSVESFPGGGPYKSCANLYPKHKVNAQTSRAPYNINVTPLEYSPGDELTIVLSGQNGEAFKGFMIRANRLKGDTEELVGQFVQVPGEGVGKFWYPDQQDQVNCVTHSSPEVKDSVTLKWKAPNETLGDIQFLVTFVKNFKTFWVLQPSSKVIAREPLADNVFISEVSTYFKDMVLEGECGVTKGCMLYPSFCSGEDCNVAVTYKSHSAGVDFEAMAVTQGYLTFAISEDGLMGTDETITCMVKEDYVSVQHGFNPAYYNDRHSIVGITNIETKREDDKLFCRWTMPYVNNITHIIESTDKPLVKKYYTFDLTNKWRLFLAWGNLYAGADVLGKHQELPLVSKGQVNLLEPVIVRANGLYFPMKLHGTFMLIGYMALISLGVVVSRHYKENFYKRILGTKLWFQIHRGVSVLAVLCVCAGFITIFVELKAWTTKNGIHAIIGTVTTGLTLIQVIFGLLRPKPTSSVRPLFNWAHRLTGKLAHIGSAVAIVLSLFTPYINHQLKQWLAVTIAAWICVQLFWEVIVFEIYKCSHVEADVGEGDAENMSELDTLKKKSSGNNNSATASSRRFLTIQFVLFSVVLLGITIAAVTFIFMF